MDKLVVSFLLLSIVVLLGAESEYPLDHMQSNIRDKASLQRGAQTYMNYCSGCHATKFQRYERVADDLGIPHDLMMENLVFTSGSKIGDLMNKAMNDRDAKEWFGASPPDLTLVARVWGADWLYTYLRTFYRDPLRPFGVNNKVFPDVGMPHVLLSLQGEQIDTCKGNDFEGIDPLTGTKLCGLVLDTNRKGALTVAEYDQLAYDLVNFLVYSAEPYKLERQRIGFFVLFFLAFFFVFAFLLKREYWKDVH